MHDLGEKVLSKVHPGPAGASTDTGGGGVYAKVGAATKFLKPLPLLPLHWLIEAAPLLAPFFQTGETATRYSATATTTPLPKYPIKGSGRGEAGGTDAPPVEKVCRNFT